jgi:glucose/arabinose dehydrogenase
MKSLRRTLVFTTILGVALLLAALRTMLAAAAPNSAGAGNALGVDTELFAQALDEPVDIAFTGIPTDTRMFVVERDGRIKIVQQNGTVLPTPFLDIDARVDAEHYGEEGLLGLAFAPDYAQSGQFYVYYTYAITTERHNRVARYQVNPINPNVALTTETEIIALFHPVNPNHNGGDLNFGPDGYLYIAPGDGGGGDDDNNGLPVLDNDAQRLNSLLGKVLRINVTGVPTYTIPASNPFTQTAGARPEIWAWGLRNPWRFSFDSATGDMFIGDVGQGSFEEIDRQTAGSTGGENYGWRCYEGFEEHVTEDCDLNDPFVPPVFAYGRTLGSVVTGGFVYRGSAYPSLVGYYFFADYGSGRFWALNTANNAVTLLGPLTDVANPSTFGQNAHGEIYVADLSGGDIYRLTGPQGPIPLQTPVWLPLVTR